MNRLAILLAIFLTLTRCANQTAPTGGPQDKTPPELVGSNPERGEKNYKGKTIQLHFNEDIKLKDPKEEILITPSVGKKTSFVAKKRSLLITPENNLETNTTYSISFREAVQDLTEGNPAENLSLAFSTGPTIDSLSISGNVKYLFKEQIPEKITVAIYQSDTFDIFKHAPTYFTKTNKAGEFKLTNLKSGNYFIYAFDDKNKNLKVDSKSEKYDFAVDTIPLTKNIEKIELALYPLDSRPPKLTNIRHAEHVSSIRFNKDIKHLQIKSERTNEIITSFASSKSELLIYKPENLSDSIKIELTASDSLEQRIDSTFYIKKTDAKLVEDAFKVTLTTSSYNIQKKEALFEFNFTSPLKQISRDSCFIKLDSINTIPLLEKDFKIDTLHHTTTLRKEFTPEQDEKEEEKSKPKKPASFYFGKGAFISIKNDSSKKISSAPTIRKEEETGTLSLEVETKEKEFIIQLLSNNKIVSSVKNVKKHTFTFLEPSTYTIHILIDSNKDGEWSPGNFYKKTPSEKIIIYKNQEKSSEIPIRANWEYGPVSIKF